MNDQFHSHAEGLSSPPANAMPVTPDDTQDLPFVCRCINVASVGTVRITTLRGDTVAIHVAAGTAFPIRARRIWATGTTAAGIVALY